MIKKKTNNKTIMPGSVFLHVGEEGPIKIMSTNTTTTHKFLFNYAVGLVLYYVYIKYTIC